MRHPRYAKHASWVQQLTWNLHRRHRWHAFAFLPMLWFSCAAPKAGQKCSGGDAYCQGVGACLACKDGTLTAFECTGPKGCSKDSDSIVHCDQSEGAKAATLCLPEYEGTGLCADDGGSRLQCVGGTWAAVACPVGQACHTDSEGIRCR